MVTGGTIGVIFNAIKNGGDIILILNKPWKELTLDDAATVATLIPIFNDIVKAFSKAKALKDRVTKGDENACYRKNWSISPISACKEGQSKFLNFMCMDDCDK